MPAAPAMPAACVVLARLAGKLHDAIALQPRTCLQASLLCELDGRGPHALIPALIPSLALQLVPPLPAGAPAAAGGAAGTAQQAQQVDGGDAMMTDG